MVELIAYTQGKPGGLKGRTPEELLTHAFSQCYQKEANIQVVTKHLKHGSVLEHIQFMFDIQLSRVAWEQLVRHRIGSYTAQSHRYTDIGPDDVTFYIPSEIDGENAAEWMKDAEEIYNIYKKWRGKGVKKETARYLAPKGVAIKATVSYNLRSLLNLLSLRTDSHAQEEIKQFAEAVWAEVKPLFPNLADVLERSFR